MDEIQRIRRYLHNLDDRHLTSLIADAAMADLLYLWDDLDREQELKIFSLLDLERKVDLIGSLPGARQEALITALSAEHARFLLEEMDPDDLTDFMQSISQEVRESVWNSLSEEAKQETLFLLKFDADDAAGLMTPRYLAIAARRTVSQALAWVRKSAKSVETIYYITIGYQLIT